MMHVLANDIPFGSVLPQAFAIFMFVLYQSYMLKTGLLQS